jgi:lipopolysaccharide export system protein LptA
MKLATAVIALCMLAIAAPSWSAPPKTPVQIEADQMLANQKENSVYFSGRVEAKQDELTIHADEMTVYYAAGAGAGAAPAATTTESRDIRRLLAKGKVEITKQEWVATGDQAEYFSDERKVVLTGNTKVWQENNLVTGDTFVLYLDEGKSIVERGKKKGERVKAYFYPDDNKPAASRPAVDKPAAKKP